MLSTTKPSNSESETKEANRKPKKREITKNPFQLVYEGKSSEDVILSKDPPNLAFSDETNLYLPNRPMLTSTSKITYYISENEALLRWLISNGFSKRFQLIYIDPPYGTGSTFLIEAGTSANRRATTVSRPQNGVIGYHDTLDGPGFIEFMRIRLILLRELLSETGLIFVHIDEKYGFEIKVIMDEIFGRSQFVNHISRIASNPKNFKRKGFGSQKDMILVYSKSKDFVWNEVTSPYTEEEIARLFPQVDENGERYTTNPLHAPGETKNGPTGQPWRGIYPPPGRHWRYPPEVLDQLDAMGLIVWSEKGVPRKKIYAKDHILKGKRIQDVWEYKDPVKPTYPTEKNIEMLKLIVKVGSNQGDLVLDAFAGSGTTLLAAGLLGRQAIGIDSSSEAVKAFASRILKNKELLGRDIKIIRAVQKV